MVPLSLVPVIFVLTPLELIRNKPPSRLLAAVRYLSPVVGFTVIEVILGKPSPILLSILLELSNKIKIFAFTSPSPEPGGKGFAFIG